MNIFMKRNFSFLSLIIVLTMILLNSSAVHAEEADSDETTVTISFEQGDLHLLTVPELVFGDGVIYGTTHSYDTASNCEVEINDGRGNGSGWTLTASLSEFSQKIGDEYIPSLEGAYITEKDQIITAEDNDNLSGTPVGAAVLLVSGSDAVEVLNAEKDCGLGQWNSLGSEVELTVISGTARAGDHMAVISWSLQDTP